MLRRLAALTGALTLACACAATASAADLHLSTTGTDAGDCSTAETACRSFAYAHDLAVPGDRIRFAAGTYSTNATTGLGSVNVFKPNLTLAGPRAGETGVGRTTGPEAVVRAASNPSFGAITVQAAGAGAVVDGLRLEPVTAGTGTIGVLARGATTVRNVYQVNLRYGVQSTAPLTVHASRINGWTTGIVASGGAVALTASSVGGNDLTISLTGVGLTATGNTFFGGVGRFALVDTPAIALHGNSFVRPGPGGTYFTGSNAGPVDAEDNFFGCDGTPGTCGRPLSSGVAVDAEPWLTLTATADATSVAPGGTFGIQATLARNSAGVLTPYGTFAGTPVFFYAEPGTVAPESVPLTTSATAAATVTAPASGSAVEWIAQVDAAAVFGTVPIVATPPTAAVAPGSLDFAGVVRGSTSAPQTVTVTNSGGSPLQVSQLRPTGTGSSLFDVVDDTCVATPVPAGGSCTFDVVFAPVATGTWTPRVQVLSNAPTVAVRLAGSGVEPLSIAPGELALEAVRGESATQTLTVTNDASSAVAFNGVTIGGTGKSLFAVTGSTCGSSLAAGASCTVDVRFAPVAAGTWNPTVTVRTGAGPFVVPTEGVGLPVWDVSPASHDFGSVARGSLRSQTFTVVNNGAMTSGVSFEKVGTGKSQFAVDPGDCPSGFLGAGASCAFTVTFAPQVVGSWAPTLTVRTGHGGKQIALAGQGT